MSNGRKIVDAIDERGKIIADTIASFGVGTNYSGTVIPTSSNRDLDLKALVKRDILSLLGTSPLERAGDNRPDAIKKQAGQLVRSIGRTLVPRQYEGRVIYELQQGRFGPEGISNEEEVKGAQATLYIFTKNARDTVEKLLFPIQMDPPSEDVEFLKSDILLKWNYIVQEVGREGDVSEARITTLLGTAVSDVEILKEILDLSYVSSTTNKIETKDIKKNINIAAWEQNLANLLLVRNLGEQLGNFIKLKLNKFSSGTLIARLAHVVQTIPVTVQQVYLAMELADFNELDRRACEEVGNTLEWIRRMVEDDWYPRLSDRDVRWNEILTMRDNVIVMSCEIQRLLTGNVPGTSLVDCNKEQCESPIKDLISIGNQRVIRGLIKLQGELQLIEKYTDSIETSLICASKEDDCSMAKCFCNNQ
jgi:hypothetical protein